MALVEKLETQRRIAERGLKRAQILAEKNALAENDVDLFQHMLDELKGDS